jgi:hypothetical protein
MNPVPAEFANQPAPTARNLCLMGFEVTAQLVEPGAFHPGTDRMSVAVTGGAGSPGSFQRDHGGGRSRLWLIVLRIPQFAAVKR